MSLAEDAFGCVDGTDAGSCTITDAGGCRAQKLPGSPTFAHFPTARLEPGEVYEHRMGFQFVAR